MNIIINHLSYKLSHNVCQWCTSGVASCVITTRCYNQTETPNPETCLYYCYERCTLALPNALLTKHTYEKTIDVHAYLISCSSEQLCRACAIACTPTSPIWLSFTLYITRRLSPNIHYIGTIFWAPHSASLLFTVYDC